MTTDDPQNKDVAAKRAPAETASAGGSAASGSAAAKSAAAEPDAAAPAKPAVAAAAAKPASCTAGTPAAPEAGFAAPPAGTAAAAAGASAASKAAAPPPPTAPPKPQPVDEFDPLGWDVPIICKDCNRGFTVPYRHFHAGVVFHCAACQGSWVPNSTITRVVRRVFEEFWGARKRARRAFSRGELKIDRAEFERRQAAELKEFKARLERQAHELKPAGKLVRPKGLAAMFT